jgi:hypothetical protein
MDFNYVEIRSYALFPGATHSSRVGTTMQPPSLLDTDVPRTTEATLTPSPSKPASKPSKDADVPRIMEATPTPSPSKPASKPSEDATASFQKRGGLSSSRYA